MVQIDENTEKQQRMEFLSANGEFMDKATKLMMQAGPAAPILGPVIMSLWKFGVTGFKVGRLIEGTIDQAADQIKALAAQPQPERPDPEMAKVQAEAQLNQVKNQQDAQAAEREAQLEHQREVLRMQGEQANAMKMEEIKLASEERSKQLEAIENARQEQFERWKTIEDNATKIEVAKIQANAQLEKQLAANEAKDDAELSAGSDGGAKAGRRKSSIDKLAEMHTQNMDSQNKSMTQQGKVLEQIAELARVAASDRKAVRGPDGRISHTTIMGPRH